MSDDTSDTTTLFPARCRTRLGVITVDVLDLTTAGCMVTSFGSVFSPGDTVSIQLPSLRLMRATVAWTDQSIAGLQFEEPLYEPVLAHLLTSKLA